MDQKQLFASVIADKDKVHKSLDGVVKSVEAKDAKEVKDDKRRSEAGKRRAQMVKGKKAPAKVAQPAPKQAAQPAPKQVVQPAPKQAQPAPVPAKVALKK